MFHEHMEFLYMDISKYQTYKSHNDIHIDRRSWDIYSHDLNVILSWLHRKVVHSYCPKYILFKRLVDPLNARLCVAHIVMMINWWNSQLPKNFQSIWDFFFLLPFIRKSLKFVYVHFYWNSRKLNIFIQSLNTEIHPNVHVCTFCVE